MDKAESYYGFKVLWIDLVILVRRQLDQEAGVFYVPRPQKLRGFGGFFEEDDGLSGGNT